MDLPQAASVIVRALKTILVLPFLSAAFAQGVVVDHWTNENGLPVNSIRGICQGPEGYLWLATYDGLARFDGVRFVPFNKSNSEGIRSDRFFGLVCGRDGGFWAPTEGQGLTHYSKGRFRTYTDRDGLDSNGVAGLTEDQAGDLWVLTENTVSTAGIAERIGSCRSTAKSIPTIMLSSRLEQDFILRMPKDCTYSTMGGKPTTGFRQNGACRTMSL